MSFVPSVFFVFGNILDRNVLSRNDCIGGTGRGCRRRRRSGWRRNRNRKEGRSRRGRWKRNKRRKKWSGGFRNSVRWEFVNQLNPVYSFNDSAFMKEPAD